MTVSESEHANAASPFSRSADDILRACDVRADAGLSAQEAQKRLQRHGPNKLHEHPKRSAWLILASQFKSLVVALLIAAIVVSLAAGDITEAVAILVVVIINAVIGFVTEERAARSMQALHQLGVTETRVRRDGKLVSISAEHVVPGDIVALEAGDIVTADIRIVTASKLQADESPLTGESMPVAKTAETLSADTPLPGRVNMLYKGTSITRGTVEGVVIGTGVNTELGAISELVEAAEDEETPLETQLSQLGRRLIGVIILIVAIVASVGVLRGNDLLLMLETGIALAVASVPEGLPIVATIALSRGMLRMARRHALVRRLHSVETLGSTSIVCTDKTGTLTENKMTLTRIILGGIAFKRTAEGSWSGPRGEDRPQNESVLQRALDVAVLCNNAAAESDGYSGDPLETALLNGARELGADIAAIRNAAPEVREEPFDSETKMMATYHEAEGQIFVAVKGAPEAILKVSVRHMQPDGERELSDADRTALMQENESLAREGFRVLALAYRHDMSADAPPYQQLTWLGLLGLIDPPRRDIRPAIEECRRAGIRIVMVTGDQAETARYVASEVGIAAGDASVLDGTHIEKSEPQCRQEVLDTDVFARVSPKQKLQLVELHQDSGNIVAMTGDGINDAPALKKADIGVAMGQRGTQVAREVADIVLKDDSFKTIVYAVREGRVIYANIRKFVLYLLSCNVAEIMVIFLATLTTSKLPLLPLQILFLNFVTDVFPAFALGAGEGGTQTMDRPPRSPKETILTHRHWCEIFVYGLFISFATLIVFFTAHEILGRSDTECVTASFLTLALAQLIHVFNMREHDASLRRNQITRNPLVWGAIALCIALLLLAVYLQPLAAVLNTTPLPFTLWLLVISCSFIPLLLDLLARTVYRVAPR